MSREEYFFEFRKRLWVTKGCRFGANRRLSLKHQISTFTLSLLSVYVIAVSLFGLVFAADFENAIITTINLSAVVVSLFILTLSNVESGKGYQLKAAMLLKSAQKISELYNELEFQNCTEQISNESLYKLNSEYDKIISDIPENHDEVDFLYFKTLHKKDFGLNGFGNIAAVLNIKAKYYFDICGFYFFSLVTPPILMVFIYKLASSIQL